MLRNFSPLQAHRGRVKATCAVMLVTLLLAGIWLASWISTWLLNTFN